MDKKMQEIKDLALRAGRGQATDNFSLEDVNESLAEIFRGMAGSIHRFNKNKYDIYEIITSTADDITPNKVIQALGVFAEVRVLKQGQKQRFTRKLGRRRAKMFLTQAALSGVYETFRLDKENFEVSVNAVGGAVSIDFERMLDGEENMAELMEIIIEAQIDSVFLEVQKALRAAYDNMIDANKVTSSSFDAKSMVGITNVVGSYGTAIIFAPPEFVAAMGPDAIVPGTTSFQGVYAQDDIDAIHLNGRIRIFRGTPIVEIPQSYVDENNQKTWIDPQIAYILPAGKEKVVKVVLEGETQMWDSTNRDQSMEINMYKKIGVGILSSNYWGIYKNTGITQTYDENIR